jgi:hypothetical protein
LSHNRIANLDLGMRDRPQVPHPEESLGTDASLINRSGRVAPCTLNQSVAL